MNIGIFIRAVYYCHGICKGILNLVAKEKGREHKGPSGWDDGAEARIISAVFL